MSADYTKLIFPNHANIGTFFWATVHPPWNLLIWQHQTPLTTSSSHLTWWINPVSPTVVASNQNHHRFVYAMHEPSKPSAFTALNNFDHTTYLSLGGRFNSCLDSGCTDYIITDWALFQNYTAEGAVDIGMANCGSLSAKGLGDVTFRVPFENHYVLFTLCGCLHAPDVPINLISVNAFNESQLTVVF